VANRLYILEGAATDISCYGQGSGLGVSSSCRRMLLWGAASCLFASRILLLLLLLPGIRCYCCCCCCWVLDGCVTTGAPSHKVTQGHSLSHVTHCWPMPPTMMT
jgi:hypothetical protein